MKPARSLRAAAPLIGVAAIAATACAPGQGYAPPVPVLRYDVSAMTKAKLADDGTARDQVRGALDFLFGSPAHPGYARLESWIDEEFDPNYTRSFDLDDARLAELADANRKTFAKQLAHIEAGRFEKVEPPREALDLIEEWRPIRAGYDALRLEVRAGKAQESAVTAYVAEHKAGAAEMFTDWYPSLRESAELYRQQCLHCHGTEGGADGSTARFLSPRPRNYQRGWFKWTSVGNKKAPLRADLYRVIENGVNGTAMLSFKRFSPAWIEGLVDYVRLLSIRGRTEELVVGDYDADEGIELPKVLEAYELEWQRWLDAEKSVISVAGEVPRPTADAIAHGKTLFNDPKGADCAKCHGEDGRGFGASAFELNAAGERVRIKDEWGNELYVRDLTSGIYRGGQRPIDLFRRVRAGITGTPMPAQEALSESDVWAIIHYVRSLAAHENRL